MEIFSKHKGERKDEKYWHNGCTGEVCFKSEILRIYHLSSVVLGTFDTFSLSLLTRQLREPDQGPGIFHITHTQLVTLWDELGLMWPARGVPRKQSLQRPGTCGNIKTWVQKSGETPFRQERRGRHRCPSVCQRGGERTWLHR